MYTFMCFVYQWCIYVLLKLGLYTHSFIHECLIFIYIFFLNKVFVFVVLLFIHLHLVRHHPGPTHPGPPPWIHPRFLLPLPRVPRWDGHVIFRVGCQSSVSVSSHAISFIWACADIWQRILKKHFIFFVLIAQQKKNMNLYFVKSNY